MLAPLCKIASLIAASGPIALDTSFAPWAKDSNAAPKIRAGVNNLLTLALSLDKLSKLFSILF